MVNQDSFTPQEYAKMVGMFPDPPQNPLPTGGYMDEGFDWVVHQAETFGADNMTVRSQIVVKDDNDKSIDLDESDKEKLEDELEDMEIDVQETTLGNLHVSRITGVEIHDAETFGAEARPISDEGELLVVRNDMGQTKGFIEMEEDLEDDSIEMEISDDEMEEIAEITLDTEYEVSIERKMIQHLDGVDIEADSQKELKEKAKEIGYERSDDFVNTKVVGGMDGYSIAHQDLVKESDFVKPSRDWFSLALGTAAVVIGGSLFLQNRGVFKADGDGTETAPSLVAHPSTGDLLPADYEEMVVESTGYAVPVIPVSLDPAFMGSRFHALPTDRVVESNEPGIGAHTDVAMTRDTNYREPEQTMVTEPPFAYKFNAEKKLSLLDRIKAFFMGHKDVKEANSITGQTPYFGVGFEPKNPQTRVIKETRPISLDPSTAPYLPTNLSGYTGQSYTPPSVYSDMMQIGITGQTPSFVSSQSSLGENRAGSRPVATSDSLQSVHGNLSAGLNQSYTDGSKTMSLSQWSIEYDVSQISDSEAFAVSRSSGERTMIRRV